MKKPHYIKQWRKFRNLTQERLADRLEMNQGHLSQIENYRRPYNQALLEVIALALNCEPADLIMRDPSQDDAIWSVWDKVPPQERSRVLTIIKTFAEEKKTGS